MTDHPITDEICEGKDAKLFQHFVRLSHELRDTACYVQNDYDQLFADGWINPSDVLASKESFTTRMTTLIDNLRELQAATERRLEDVHKQHEENN